ncbi:MAG: UDP-N-acetylmuramate--L-alanine ligase [Acidaminococcales bacterium]|jgi:UDP-N-acetylmuramate--alanine ligase|nr:UDP-N-acetylmuramate--L-alanine ligase [Acidaminococcales bacterium]
MFDKIKKWHFIGIGGVGMSAVACVLNKTGLEVSGSDAVESALSRKLAADGVRIYIGHASGQIGDCGAVVLSSAIKQTNPEALEAKERGIPIFHRSDVLAALLNSRRGVTVAGAHGKTTTTALLSHAAIQAGLDPTVLIGGEVASLGGNARCGKGQYLIAEADESDGSFLKFFPYLSIVTNIENDHMDYYRNMDRMNAAFTQFIAQTAPEGAAVLCFDDARLRLIAKETGRRVISYGIAEEADYQACNISYGADGTTYDLYFQGKFLCELKLIIPGRHNVLNSLAVVAAARFMGLDAERIAPPLASFRGVKRRFELKGKIDGITVVDDYAHHPSEIKNTLAAAAQKNPSRLIGVFQPHRYTRTKLLKEEFGQAFALCDRLVLTDIYAAGEEPIQQINGRTLLYEIQKTRRNGVVYQPDIEAAAGYLENVVQPGDLIITLGAGDIYKAGELLLSRLKKRTLESVRSAAD